MASHLVLGRWQGLVGEQGRRLLGKALLFKNRRSYFITWTLDLGFEGWIGVFQIDKEGKNIPERRHGTACLKELGGKTS